MNFNIPTDKTILVFANYRTGSTAFCDWLSKKVGLINYDEAFHPFSQQKIDYKNNKCIIKIMPGHTLPMDFDDLVKKSFVIGIQRRSLIEQIASFYICDKTRHWHQHKNERTYKYQIEIDMLGIEDQISYILEMQEDYKKLPYLKDLEIYYEDIGGLLNESKYAESPKPSNYNELLSTVESLVDKVKERTLNDTN